MSEEEPLDAELAAASTSSKPLNLQCGYNGCVLVFPKLSSLLNHFAIGSHQEYFTNDARDAILKELKSKQCSGFVCRTVMLERFGGQNVDCGFVGDCIHCLMTHMVDKNKGHRDILQAWFTKKTHDKARAKHGVRQRKRKRDSENDRIITFSDTISRNLPCQLSKPAISADVSATELIGTVLRELFAKVRAPSALVDAVAYASDPANRNALKIAFFDAVCNKQHEVVSFIVERKMIGVNERIGTDLNTALHYAAEVGDDRMLQILLGYGATPTITNEDDSTALHIAALNGNQAMVQILIAHRADVNMRDKNRHTPLMLALLGRNHKVVKLLLEHGAEITGFYDCAVPGVSSSAIIRRSLLSQAIRMDDCEEIVELLLEWIDRSDDTYSEILKDISHLLIEIAPMHGSARNVESLLKPRRNSRCRANVNHTDSEKETALMLASRSGNYDTVERLLFHGAKTDPKNPNGDDALSLATASGEHRVVKMLLEHEKVAESDITRCLKIASFWAHEKVIQVLLDHWPSESLPAKVEEAIDELESGMALQRSFQDKVRVLGTYLLLTEYSSTAKNKMDLWDRISIHEQRKFMEFWKSVDESNMGHLSVEETLKHLESLGLNRQQIEGLIRESSKSERFLDQYDFVVILRSVALIEKGLKAFNQAGVMDVKQELIPTSVRLRFP